MSSSRREEMFFSERMPFARWLKPILLFLFFFCSLVSALLRCYRNGSLYFLARYSILLRRIIAGLLEHEGDVTVMHGGSTLIDMIGFYFKPTLSFNDAPHSSLFQVSFFQVSIFIT